MAKNSRSMFLLNAKFKVKRLILKYYLNNFKDDDEKKKRKSCYL